MVSATVKDRIIIHLYTYHASLTKQGMPYELSQPGIADAIGISRPHLSQEIRKMIQDEPTLVKEEVMRVKGLKRKRKVYFLTPKGVLKAQSSVEKFNEESITVLTSDGKKDVKLKNIGTHIKGNNPLVTALSRVDAKGVLDLTEAREFKEDIFIDRKEEMAVLKSSLKEASEEGGKVFFVKGDPGIGKTRLLEEFEKHASSEDFIFLSGRAYFESSDPYLPFKKAFEGTKDLDHSMDIIYPDEKRTKAEDKNMFDYHRRTTFFEITKDIRHMIDKKPMVIFLDDIQWADSATLQLIHYLSENLETSPLLLIAAFRPQDVNMNTLLKEIVQRMRRVGTYEEIELKPLKWKHTKEIISNMLGVSRTPPEFVRLLYELSQGNPLFIKECVKSLIEEGNLDPKRNRYPKDPRHVTIPNIIVSIIERRFSQLSEETLKMLQIGCIIGEEIPFDLLLKVCGMDELDAFDHIDILLGTSIWKELPDQDKFAFSHALVHLAAYNRISDIKKRKLHKAVAEKLEELYEEDIEKHHSKLAKHFERAGMIDRSISYYYKAGKSAETVYAQEDALEMYQNALRLWDGEDKEPGMKLMESLGDVNSLLGDISSCKKYYERILDETDNEVTEQRMYRKLARLCETQGDFRRVKELVDKGLDSYKKDNIEACRLYEIRGWTLMQTGDFQGAEEMFITERRLSEDLGDRKALSDSNHNLGTLMVYKANYDDARRYLKDALRIREKIGDKKSIAKSLNNLGVVYKCTGDIEDALETYQRCLEIEKEIGDRGGIAATSANLGTLQYMNNNPKEAGENFDHALEIFRGIGDKMGVAMAYNNLGIVQLAMGDLESALEYQKRGLELRKNVGDKPGLGMTHGIISSVFILKGELDKAKEHIDEAFTFFEKIDDVKGMALMKSLKGDIKNENEQFDDAISLYEESHKTLKQIGEKFENISNCCRLAEVYTHVGKLTEARRMIIEGIMLSKMVGTDYDKEVFLRILGMVLRKEKNFKGSFKVLNKAAGLLEKNKKYMELARVYYELGKTFLEVHDVPNGKRNLAKARNKFNSMDMERWSARAQGMLDDI
ncbi:MAG: tetratricopeptide repeat protein [Thermoplasmata archaeon]